MNYFVQYKFDDGDWHTRICLSFLRQQKEKYKTLHLKFRNDWDKLYKHKSSEDWLNVVKPLGFADKMLALSSDADGIYISFDLTKVSYEWILSIVSLVRPLGEYYSIVYNYWMLKELYPKMKDWDAIFVAHQLNGMCLEQPSYSSAHTIFMPGQEDFTGFSFDRVKEKLDTYPPWVEQEYWDNIQPIWHTFTYGYVERFDKTSIWFPRLFKTDVPYFVEKE